MVNDVVHQDEQEKKSEANKSPESAVAQAMRVIENTEVVKDSKRQIRYGSLLGTCLVFITAMLSVSEKQMDAPLTFALTSFASAIPLLVFGFWTAGFKPKPVQGGMVLVALLAFGGVVEALGWVAIGIGVFAVIAHLSMLAFTVSLWTAGLTIPASIFCTLVGVLIYAYIQIKKEQKKSEK